MSISALIMTTNNCREELSYLLDQWSTWT